MHLDTNVFSQLFDPSIHLTVINLVIIQKAALLDKKVQM